MHAAFGLNKIIVRHNGYIKLNIGTVLQCIVLDGKVILGPLVIYKKIRFMGANGGSSSGGKRPIEIQPFPAEERAWLGSLL